MALKSLSFVIETAINEPSFREELLKNPDSALATKGWELTPTNLEKLHEFVSDEFYVVIDAKKLLKAFSNIMRGEIPPPPIWQTMRKMMPYD